MSEIIVGIFVIHKWKVSFIASIGFSAGAGNTKCTRFCAIYNYYRSIRNRNPEQAVITVPVTPAQLTVMMQCDLSAKSLAP